MKKNNELVGLREELSKVWSEKMVNFCIKSTEYIKIDNLFIAACDKKPSITKDIYYNDECEAPTNNKETFMTAQEHNFPQLIKDPTNLYLINHYDGSELIKGIAHFYPDEVRKGATPLTDEMVEEINKVIEKARAKYTKRLENYYKRYSDNIYIHGYWANR